MSQMKRWVGVTAITAVVAGAAPAWASKLPVKATTLPNGLKVLMVENHKAPVVSLQVWYRVGSRNEQVGQTGLAHLTEHMMFQGSKRFPGGKYKELVEAMGGDYNAFTTEDMTAYYINSPADKLELAAQLEADRMGNLLIPAEKFGSEREVVKEERRWRTENSPFGMMYEMIGSTAYTAHPYRWPVVGWMSDLDKVSREDSWRFYKTYYHPNNATLVITGDFKADQALSIVKRTFGVIKAGPKPPEVRTVEPPQQGERRTRLVKPVETPSVMMAYHVPPAGHADGYVLKVISNLLYKGNSSRLHHDLVYTKKIAQEVGGWSGSSIDPGLYLLYGVPLPGHTAEALEEGIYAQLDRLKTEPVSDRDLEKARNQVEAEFLFGQQKAEQTGNTLGEAETVASYTMVNQFVDKIRAVSKEDIMRVAKTYFSPTNRSVVTLVPAKEAM